MKQGFEFFGHGVWQKLAVMFFLAVVTVTAGYGQTLGQALNATGLTWTTPLPNQWGVTTAPSQTHDGISAAKSGLVSGSLTSTLQTTVAGPGKISFWWNVSDYASGNLSFTVNGVAQTNFFQWGDWRQETIFLPSGSQTLRWICSGSGFGLVDEVNYTPGTFAPEITYQPPGQSQVPGLNTMFASTTQGTPPLSYQWQFNGTNLPAATNSFVIVSNTQQADLGSYQIVVTNVAGSVTSLVAVLEFGQVAAWGQLNPIGWANATNGMTNIMGIAAGVTHNLALKTDGNIVGWGRNYEGELSFPISLTNVTSVAADFRGSMALFSNGEALVLGLNNSGATGITNMPSSLTNVVSIALGGSHAMALKSDGTVTSWGYNGYGQTNTPVGLSNVVSIAAGNSHSLAVRS